MADSEFEEFRKTLDTFPSHLKTASPFYTLVPDLLDDDYPSSKSDSSDQEDDAAQHHRMLGNHKTSPKSASTTIGSNNSNHSHPHHHHRTLKHDTSGVSSSSTSTESSVTVSKSSDEDDEIGDGLRTIAGSGLVGTTSNTAGSSTAAIGLSVVGGGSLVGGQQTIVSHAAHMQTAGGQVERRRRKLPEIPKNRTSFVSQYIAGQTASLTDDLAGGRGSGSLSPNITAGGGIGSYAANSAQRSMLAMKCGYLLDEDSSPDSERMTSLGDVDSGHSTAHSPTDLKSMSPTPSTQRSVLQSQAKNGSGNIIDGIAVITADAGALGAIGTTDTNAAGSIDGDADSSDLCTTPFQPPAFGGIPYSQIEMLEPTHRGLHKFVPRHRDEIEVEIGDSVYVQKEADDLWCEGVNLRTGRQGIFPSAYAVDLDYNDFDPTAPKVKRERYLLGYLGSVETLAHKGTGVVCQAVRKIVGEFGESPAGQLCILEISDQGLRMVDRSNKQLKKEPKKPCIDYFYSLKNVSFCAFHPRDHRYIGFITKHPTIQRFACHVFKGHESTRPVAEAVGRAFQHFYQKFIETAYPIEDIYIE